VNVASLRVNNYAGNRKYKKVGRVVGRNTKHLTGHVDNVNGVIKIEGLS